MRTIKVKYNALVALLMLLFMSGISLSSFAAPAMEGIWKTLKLTNGSSVKAELKGDEHYSYWKSSDGRCFIMVENSDLYEEISIETINNNYQKARARKAAAIVDPLYGVPHETIGEFKGLVILVEFPKGKVAGTTEETPARKFQSGHTRQYYEEILNTEGYTKNGYVGSVYDYFKSQSHGLFKLKFDVAGPFTLTQPSSYYGKKVSESRNDEHKNDMIVEACDLAAKSGVDYSKYDWNNDGTIEQVFVLYAGEGENTSGVKDDIWPSQYYLPEELNRIYNGKKLYSFACSSEISYKRESGIGTFCHEFSHCLGVPDCYTKVDNAYDPGHWDLMALGNYSGNGICPPGYSAYEKMFCGWLEPEELKQAVEIKNLKTVKNGGKAYIIYNKANHNEFYLLENRQKSGWDTYLPGAGLTVHHVCYDEKTFHDNKPNDTPGKPGYNLVPADGSHSMIDEKTDAYPIVNDKMFGNNNCLSNVSPKQAAVLWTENSDGSKYLNYAITNITQNDDRSISFKGRPEANTPKSLTFNADVSGVNLTFRIIDWGEREVQVGDGLNDAANYDMMNRSLTIPDVIYREGESLPYNVVRVAPFAFFKCDKLEIIRFAPGMRSIGRNAFARCTSLKSILLAKTIEEIEDNAFYGCTKLQTITSEIIDPSKVSVFSNSFYGHPENTSLSVRPGYEEAYRQAKVWKEFDIVSTNSVGTNFTAEINGISIPFIITGESTVQIGDGKSPVDYPYTRLTIPEQIDGRTITKIGDHAFRGNTSLEYVEIPASVTEIGKWAFAGCPALRTVEFLSDVSPAFDKTTSFANNNWVKILIPSGSHGAYSDFGDLSNVEVVEGMSSWSDQFKVVSQHQLGSGICTLEKKIDYGDYLENPDGTKFFKTSLALGVIYKGVKSTKVIADDLYTQAEYSSASIPCMIYDIDHRVVTIFANSYTGYYYGMNGFAYRFDLDKRTVTTETVFEMANFGWFSHFTGASDGNPELWHFSFAGYYGMMSYRNSDGQWDTYYVSKTMPEEADADYPNYDNMLLVGEENHQDVGTEIEHNSASYSIGTNDNVAIIEVDDDVKGDYVIPESIDDYGKEYQVNEIAPYAFYGCNEMTSVTIPESVQAIGASAFGDCMRLTSIIVMSKDPIDLENSSSPIYRIRQRKAIKAGAGSSYEASQFNGVDKEICTLYVPDGSVSKYRSAYGWNEFINIQPISTTSIAAIKEASPDNESYDLSGQKINSKSNNHMGKIIIKGGKKIITHY